MRRYLVALSVLLLVGSVGAAEQDDAGRELRRHLRGTKWQWDGGAGETVVFGDNGYVENEGWTRRGLITRWEAIDRRTVLLHVERGRPQDLYALLVFNEDMSLYDGFNFHGGARFNVSTQLPMGDERRTQQAEAAYPTFFRATSGTQSLRSGLVAFYPFNRNANDESGNANHGTVYGATPCEDRHGNKNSGFLFDGVDDYIKFGQSLPDMTTMTICAWVFAENDVAFLSDGDWALDNDVTIQAGPGFVIVRADKGGHQLYDKLDVGVELHQQWRHIAWTMTSEQSNVYIDGSHRAGVEKSGSNVGFHNFMLGTMEYPKGSVGWLGYWKGRISSLRIYSRILSGEEIREIYDLDDRRSSTRGQTSSSDTGCK